MWEYEAVNKLEKEVNQATQETKVQRSSWRESAKTIAITVVGGVLAAYTIKHLKKAKLL